MSISEAVIFHRDRQQLKEPLNEVLYYMPSSKYLNLRQTSVSRCLSVLVVCFHVSSKSCLKSSS